MRVRVYYNLSRSVWSIKAMEGEFKGRIIGYADAVVLSDAHTVVSEVGRQRVLRERRKNVHAYIDGQLEQVSGYQERLMVPPRTGYLAGLRGKLYNLYYNPYHVDHFIWASSSDSPKGKVLPEVFLMSDRKVQAVRP